jgi:hypothetical protein
MDAARRLAAGPGMATGTLRLAMVDTGLELTNRSTAHGDV